MRRPRFTPMKIPGTHFYQRLSRPQGHNAAGRIRSTKKSNDIDNRTRDLPACSIVPQPTTVPRFHLLYIILNSDKPVTCVITEHVRVKLML
jgi:hypothetical protein